MNFDDDINATAALVQRADPDRFRAIMAAPVPLRIRFFPIFAMNIEIARAPWVTKEQMIAEMRLQWWHDALEEIAANKNIRRHEVVTPLSKTITPDQADDLLHLVNARRWDIYNDPFADQAALDTYLYDTTVRLLRVAAGELSQDEAKIFNRAAGAIAWANFLFAVPQLEQAGKIPLFDGRASTVAHQSGLAFDNFKNAQSKAHKLSSQARWVLFTGWRTPHVLKHFSKSAENFHDDIKRLELQRHTMRFTINAMRNRF